MKRVSLFLLAVLVVAPLPGATAAPRSPRRLPPPAIVAEDALYGALEDGRLSEAGYALERARSLFHLRAVRARYGHVVRPHPRAATMILRDLAVRVSSLRGDDRELGQAILARPEGGGNPIGNAYSVEEEAPVCSLRLCVHYVASTTDAPSRADANANGVPDYVDDVLAVFEEVWTIEVDQMGWRAPKSDVNSTFNGGNEKLDVYVTDVGAFGAYGYCTSDDPHLNRTSTYRFQDMSSYCVVDNDYKAEQFGSGTTASEALRVTAAHEFNHASQYAYDLFEDPWLQEATATWIEDEVYPDINDNLQYLASSPLDDPHVSLDTFFDFESQDPNASFSYGTWIFLRYLSERFGQPVVREIWERADGGPNGDQTINGVSIRAVAAQLIEEGETLAGVFADFGAKNVDPSEFYREGSLYNRRPPRSQTHELAAGSAATGSVTLDHLTNGYVAFQPHGLAATDNLTVAVDATDEATSPKATVVTVSSAGVSTIMPVPLDASGAGQLLVRGFGEMAEVVLVLTNGSSRFNPQSCGGSTPFSCLGATFIDDGSTFGYSGAVGDVAVTPPPSGGGNVDTTAPRITKVSDGPDPFKPLCRCPKKRVRINWTINERSQTTVAVFKRNGVTRVRHIVTGITTPTPDPDWFVTWNGRSDAGRVVRRGLYVYKIKAVDDAGNVAVKRGTVTVRR